MDMTTVTTAAGIAGLATLNVGVWTLRVALAARDRRALAALAAGLDAVLFVVTFSMVLGSLDDPVRIAAYAAGVSLGTHLGLAAEAWTRRSHTDVDEVTPSQARRWPRARRRAAPRHPCVHPAAAAVPRSVRPAAR